MLLRFVAVAVIGLALSVPSVAPAAPQAQQVPGPLRVYLPMLSRPNYFAEISDLVDRRLVWPDGATAPFSGVAVAGATTAEACVQNIRGEPGGLLARLDALAASPGGGWVAARDLFAQLEDPILCLAADAVYLLGHVPGGSVIGLRAPVVGE